MVVLTLTKTTMFSLIAISLLAVLHGGIAEQSQFADVLPFENFQHRDNCLKCKRYTNVIEYLLQQQLQKETELELGGDRFCNLVGASEADESACRDVARAAMPKLFIEAAKKMTAGKVCSDLMECGVYKLTEPNTFKDFEDYVVPQDKIDVYENGVKFRGSDFTCAVCVSSLTELKGLLADGGVAKAAVAGADKLCDSYKSNKAGHALCTALLNRYIPWLLKTMAAPIDPEAACKRLLTCNDEIDIRNKNAYCPQCQYAIEHIKPLLLRTFPFDPLDVCAGLGTYDMKGYSINDCISKFYHIRENIGEKMSSAINAASLCGTLKMCDANSKVTTDVELVKYADRFPKINIIDNYVDACSNLLHYARERLYQADMQETATQAILSVCPTLEAADEKKCESWANDFGGQVAIGVANNLNAPKICSYNLHLEERSGIIGALHGLDEFVASITGKTKNFFGGMFHKQ